MEDPACEVFCSDETRIQLEAIRRKAWLQKGERTILKLEEIIKATTEFIKLYPNKKICIVWDNATCHKGKLMRQALSKGGALERVHLINLPPYAPDVNPIEHVWNTTKDKLANKQDIVFEETKQKFMRLTDNQIFPYQI